MVIKMNKKKILKVVFMCLFLSFVVSYIIELTGYDEYNLQNKTIMTTEAMARFEKDVADGKNVREEDYLVSTEKDYTSPLTRSTNQLSIKVNKVLKKGIEGIFKIVGTLVEE